MILSHEIINYLKENYPEHALKVDGNVFDKDYFNTYSDKVALLGGVISLVSDFGEPFILTWFPNEVRMMSYTGFTLPNDCSDLFAATRFYSIGFQCVNTGNVTNMDAMFYNCQAKKLDLRTFDTSKVTDMSSMFCECEATSIDLRSFNTSKVADMSGMFLTSQIQVLKIPYFQCKFDDYEKSFRNSEINTIILPDQTLTNFTADQAKLLFR